MSKPIGSGEPGFAVIDPDPQYKIVRQASGHLPLFGWLARPSYLHDSFPFLIGVIIHPICAISDGYAPISGYPGHATMRPDKIDEVG